MPVSEFPLAVHHRYGLNEELKEEVCFIDIVAFGTVAERSKTFLQKAAQVLGTAASVKNAGKARKLGHAANTK